MAIVTVVWVRLIQSWSFVLRLIAVLGLFALQACATATNSADVRDPWESWNRGVFKFNDTVDRAVLKPVSTVYRDVTPNFVQKGISNFLNNLEDIWSAFNNAIQLRAQDTSDSIGRVMVNTTLGLFGLIDVATALNIERHPANFGLTLGRWGVKPGPYVVLPFLGPSTLRDAAGLPLDMQASVVRNLDDVTARDTLTVLDVVRTRASLLDAEKVVDGVALDKYSFIRDVYLQRRRNKVFDGNPPDDEPDASP